MAASGPWRPGSSRRTGVCPKYLTPCGCPVGDKCKLPHTGQASEAWLPRALLLGSSLTRRGFNNGGWAETLGTALSISVVNAGIGGSTTQTAVEKLPDILHWHQVAPERPLLLATVFFGCNDRRDDGEGVPLEQFRENMRRIVHLLRGCNGPNIPPPAVLLITPVPGHEARRRMMKQLNLCWHIDLGCRTKGCTYQHDLPRQVPEDPGAEAATHLARELTQQYAQAVRDVGLEFQGAPGQVQVLDLFTAFESTQQHDPAFYSKAFGMDGVHLTQGGPGDQLLGALVKEKLQGLVPAAFAQQPE